MGLGAMEWSVEEGNGVVETHFECVRRDSVQGEVRLVCIERTPAGAALDGPVALLFHGLMSHKGAQPLRAVAEALLARGIAVVQPDFNGHGESGGAFELMSVANEFLDARTVLARYAGRRIALAGHSQGAIVAALAAARLGGVDAVALLAPATIMREDALEGHILDATFDPANPPERTPIAEGKRWLGRDYIRAAQELRVHEEFAAYRGPLCVAHGTADGAVPFRCGERFVRERERAGLPVAWLPVEGADHNFREREAEVAGFVADFLCGVFGRT